MKKYLVLLVLAFVQATTFAVDIDSLRKAIPDMEDEEKSEAYKQLLAAVEEKGNVKEILQCLDEWIAFEETQNNFEAQANLRWNKIVTMTNHATDSLLLAEAPVQMTWFMHHGEWEHYYDTWDSKTNIFLYSGRVQTALREAHSILDDANSRQNNFGRAVAYQLMGIIYESIGQYDQAIKVFKQCLGQLKDSYRDAEVLTNAYDYLCQTLEEKKDYRQQLAYTSEWEANIKERMHKKSRKQLLATWIACKCNRASALIGLKRYDDAEDKLREAEQMLMEHNTPLAKYRICLIRAKHALAQGKSKDALLYCDSLEHLNLNAGGDIPLLRADILTSMGKTQEASTIYRSLYLSKDSTFTREMRMQLDELNTLYRVDELEIQSKLQRSRYLIGIGALIVIALLLFIFYSHKAAARLEMEHEKLLDSNERLEQSYKELKVANAKAEDSSRMKTNFIQQISHEIRTPLNVLSGFTQIITTPDVTLDNDAKVDISKHISENTRRITELVNKMLALSDANSRTVIERADYVPAMQIATQAADSSRITQNEDIIFDMQIAPEVENIQLHTNLQQATQALVMLLDNAQKFLHEKHPLAKLAKRGTVRFYVQKNSQMVEFVVEDTGIGIPKEEAEHIFEEFVQLNEFYDGTGIGLPVARSIARRMGGEVILDTSYNSGGSRFIFSLPVDM